MHTTLSLLLLGCGATSAFMAPPRAPRATLRVSGIREDIANREAEKADAARAKKEADEAGRLAAEYAAWKTTAAFDGTSQEAFAEKRAAVSTTPTIVGYAGFALVVLLNIKLQFLASPEIKAVSLDPHGLCTSATADVNRKDMAGLNSKGEPCMPLGDFARAVVFG